MTQLIDNQAHVRKIDKDNALGSVESFGDQLIQIWELVFNTNLPAHLRHKKKIVIAGMGGSALGGRVVKSLMNEEANAPVEVVTEYRLPHFVDQDTLVVIASYSGNTEEVLGCLKDALERKAAVVAITTGGKIGKMIRRKKIAGIIFSPQHNPLGFPKTALGYSVGGLAALFSNLGYLSYSDNYFRKAVAEFLAWQKNNLGAVDLPTNKAKALAIKLQAKISAFVASEHLKGAAYTAKNQINEIWHSGSLFFDLPELNHHLVEAFGKPKSFKEEVVYLLIQAPGYHPRNKKRFEITAKVLKKIGVSCEVYEVSCSSKLAQAFELINLGGFLSVYGSVLDGEDPGPEPWINYFKKKLGAPTR
ncbi:SIS domain-containing protein [Patescibacteria group bacterium]|nr:SIS domain-containing protein [Patescibacteria group bacterium]